MLYLSYGESVFFDPCAQHWLLTLSNLDSANNIDPSLKFSDGKRVRVLHLSNDSWSAAPDAPVTFYHPVCYHVKEKDGSDVVLVLNHLDTGFVHRHNLNVRTEPRPFC